MFAEYRAAVPGVAPTVYALYGYEAMRTCCAAIARAGPPGRRTARRCGIAFFALGEIHGVIGDYRINANGDTSLDRFDGYRVGAGGALVLVRRIS